MPLVVEEKAVVEVQSAPSVPLLPIESYQTPLQSLPAAVQSPLEPPDSPPKTYR